MNATVKTQWHRLAAGAICAVTLAAAGLPAQALSTCAAPAQAEARMKSFSAEGLFGRGGAELSSEGRQRLAALTRSLDGVDVEAVVVSVAAPTASANPIVRDASLQRAEKVRSQLVRLGVAADRVYLEQRPIRDADAALDEPLMIETIASWRAQNLARDSSGGVCVGVSTPRAPVAARG